MLFVRNYTNFKALREHINELDHFVRIVASGFMEHRAVGGWAGKYKRFDLAHTSSLLNFLLNVIKWFIQLAQVIIGVKFLQRYIEFDLLYTNFSVGTFHITIWNATQLRWWANIIILYMSFVATHASNTHKLNVSVAPLTYICSKNVIPKWHGRVFNITGQPSLQIVPTFAARGSGV